MAEKILKLNLERDYKGFLYYIDGNGDVCKKSKSDPSSSEVLIKGAITRDPSYLYFVDRDGDISRSPRGLKVPQVAAPPISAPRFTVAVELLIEVGADDAEHALELVNRHLFIRAGECQKIVDKTLVVRAHTTE